MMLVFYSVVLNHHQAPVADELYRLLGKDYAFVETVKLNDNKGADEDYSQRPYLIRAWDSDIMWQKAMNLAVTSDVCVFSGIEALPFQRARLKYRNLLSFDMSERWLKRGIVNLFSPSIFKQWVAYLSGAWHRRSLYKLCCSAFAARDQYRLGTFMDKCYKWGYFTALPNGNGFETSRDAVADG